MQKVIGKSLVQFFLAIFCNNLCYKNECLCVNLFLRVRDDQKNVFLRMYNLGLCIFERESFRFLIQIVQVH